MTNVPDVGAEQAVLVYLDGVGLPNEVYAEYDLATLEDRLEAIVRDAALGEYDGHEFGPTDVTLFFYGTDAERLRAGIEPVLSAYPLCRGARVVVRYGGPGAAQREFRVAAA